MPRFAILEHTGAPDDPAGRHFDLLLEVGDACRTWRLAELPRVGGPTVPAIELPAHRLVWLDHEAGAVSGNRGFARRVAAGAYELLKGGLSEAGATTRLVVGGLIDGHTVVLVRAKDGWRVTAGA